MRAEFYPVLSENSAVSGNGLIVFGNAAVSHA
jgi:hypothetical protein